MELKTESGVSIKIIDDGASKTLIFSTSVRAIGLSKKETYKIGALLFGTAPADEPVDKAVQFEPQEKTASSEGA